jgi:sRNA-binding regulator protein Hfq
MLKKTLGIISLLSLLGADTVTFTNGALLEGKVTKQDKTTLSIEIDRKTTTYYHKDIKNVSLDRVVSAPPPAVATPPMPAQESLSVNTGTPLHVLPT